MDFVRKGLLFAALGALTVLGTGCSDDGGSDSVINVYGSDTKIALLSWVNDYDWSDTGAESSSTDAAIRSLGHQTLPFFEIDADTISQALQDKDVLVIPEDLYDLDANISPEARSLIILFVDNGGTLVVCGGAQFDNTINLLNNTFGLSLAEGTEDAPFTYNSSGASGTPFSGGPSTLDSFTQRAGIDVTTLPVDGKAVYTDDTNGDAIVTALPYGDGWIYHLGWDFSNSEPIGVNDGGWLDILDRAVR